MTTKTPVQIAGKRAAYFRRRYAAEKVAAAQGPQSDERIAALLAEIRWLETVREALLEAATIADSAAFQGRIDGVLLSVIQRQAALRREVMA